MSKPLQLLGPLPVGRDAVEPTPVLGTVPHHTRLLGAGPWPAHVMCRCACPTGGSLGIYALAMALSNQTKSVTRLLFIIPNEILGLVLFLDRFNGFFFKIFCSVSARRGQTSVPWRVSRSRTDS
jgi:hypothetical protein